MLKNTLIRLALVAATASSVQPAHAQDQAAKSTTGSFQMTIPKGWAMVAFGDFWAINPPKVEVTVTVKVEVKGGYKDEVKRVLRAPEAACVVNVFGDFSKASEWGNEQVTKRFKGEVQPGVAKPKSNALGSSLSGTDVGLLAGEKQAYTIDFGILATPNGKHLAVACGVNKTLPDAATLRSTMAAIMKSIRPL